MVFRRRLFATALLLAALGAAPVLAQQPQAAQTQVQVQSLARVEPFRVGARSGMAFAMPASQWRGSNAAVAKQLISDLPQAGASPLLIVLPPVC